MANLLLREIQEELLLTGGGTLPRNQSGFALLLQSRARDADRTTNVESWEDSRLCLKSGQDKSAVLDTFLPVDHVSFGRQSSGAEDS